MNRINNLTRHSFYKSGSALKEGTPWPFVNQVVIRERVLLKQLLFFLEISMTWSARKTERPAHDKKRERNLE